MHKNYLLTILVLIFCFKNSYSKPESGLKKKKSKQQINDLDSSKIQNFVQAQISNIIDECAANLNNNTVDCDNIFPCKSNDDCLSNEICCQAEKCNLKICFVSNVNNQKENLKTLTDSEKVNPKRILKDKQKKVQKEKKKKSMESKTPKEIESIEKPNDIYENFDYGYYGDYDDYGDYDMSELYDYNLGYENNFKYRGFNPMHASNNFKTIRNPNIFPQQQNYIGRNHGGPVLEQRNMNMLGNNYPYPNLHFQRNQYLTVPNDNGNNIVVKMPKFNLATLALNKRYNNFY